MAHPRDIELIELVAGRSDPTAADELRRHVESCPACARRVAEIARVDMALGAWTVEPQPVNLRSDVLDAIDSQRGTPATPFWLPAMRVAAMMAVSAGIGHLAARADWQAVLPQPVPTAVVEGDLLLDTLAAAAPVGLGDVLADEAFEPEGRP